MSSTSNSWLFAGLASSFPNIEPDEAGASGKTKIANTSDAIESLPPCKIFQPSSSDPKQQPLYLAPTEAQETLGFTTQVLIFRYRGKLHAINHSCPHRNYPLSRGSVYDIEDFGIVLSTGITCPGHGWAFDINTGQSDRGTYKLEVWQVETRGGGTDGDEVWIRRKKD